MSKEFDIKPFLLNNNKVFRDAVHNYITVDNRIILELIDSKEMQRLRRIKQLGGTHQVYVSAEHTRFTHSLGVYQVAKVMCKQSCIGTHLSDYEKLIVQCAALLHDLGHGPFSHCFESVFNTNHEDFTVSFILKNSEVHTILETVHKGFSKEVAKVIEKTHTNKVLVAMVSSQLDCDRMDYLLRDSYFTGTTYGQFDLQRILRIMDVEDGKIVYKVSGVQAIEDYILARYHMYWQVYYHPTTRSYEQLLLSIFNRVKDLYSNGFDLGDIHYLKPFLNDTLDNQSYYDLDENVVMYYFKSFMNSEDKILADLSKRFLNRNLFKYQDYTNKEDENKMRNQYVEGEDQYYILCDDQTQTPYHYDGNSKGENQILIAKDFKLIPLQDISEIVGAITNSVKSKEDHKIFYPK